MSTDTRTEAERRYDTERDGSLYLKSSADEPPPVASELVQITTCSDEDATWTEYECGDVQLTRDYEYPRSPVFTLFIHGCAIRIEDKPITFQTLANLMVDLSRLLADARVRAVFGEVPLMESVRQLPRKAAPIVQVEPWNPDDDEACDRLSLSCGKGDTKAEVYLYADEPPVLYAAVESASVEQAEQLLVNLTTLLSDPRVRATRRAA